MTGERIQEILGKFAETRLLVVGDVVLDQYVRGVVERINPEAPVPILHMREESEATGGAGNVAKNTAALGAKTTLIGVVGDDPVAQRVRAAAQREGYEVQLTMDESRPTVRKVRYIVQNQQLLRVDYEDVHEVEGDAEEMLLESIKEEMAETDGVIVSDYAKGTITKRVALAVMEAARERGIPVAADFKPSRASFLAGADIVSPNIKEGHEILGLNYLDQRRPPLEIAQRLREQLAADVYLTLGADGVFVATQAGVTEHVPQDHVIEVSDVSGAGDTAIAVLMLAKLAGATPVEAATISNAGGAVVVQKVGSVAVTPEELLQMAVNKHSVKSTPAAT